MTTTTPTRGSSKATEGRTEPAAGERAGEDRLTELQQRITDGVAALVDSPGRGGGCWTPPPGSTATASTTSS